VIFYDTETCGFTGPVVLIQYADEDGPIVLHEVWKRPARETLTWIERAMDDEVCGFNLTFDQFHLSKTYNVLRLASDCSRPPNPDEYLANERRGSAEALCLKPRAALDLLLHARKGPAQAAMNAKTVFINRVPVQLAQPLADYLTQNFELDEYLFERRRDGYEWQVDEDPEDPKFPEVLLRFAPSVGLKSLATHLLGKKVVDFPIPKSLQPDEYQWCPFALERNGWPTKLPYHIEYWHSDSIARKYAREDVVYTRELYEHFGYPDVGDVESTLACAVGTARWKGFSVRLEEARAAIDDANKRRNAAPRAPNNVKRWIGETMSELELAAFKNTRKSTLKTIMQWRDHPAAERARAVFEARSADKELDTLKKVTFAGGLYPDMKVIGTKTDRMAGAGGLNVTGIVKKLRFRSLFSLAWPGEQLDGGDFDAFEVALAEAAWKDPQLREDLLSGKKIHALFGSQVYRRSDLDPSVIPGMPGDELLTYDEIKATDGQEVNLYGTAKNGVFALIFGAQYQKLAKTLNVSLDISESAEKRWWQRYHVARDNRNKIYADFTAVRQPREGGKVIWSEPKHEIETLLGFKRWFQLEWDVVRALYELANNPPREWTKLDVRVLRKKHKGLQSASGALRSALFGCCFALQGAIQRQAANTVIQGTGAQINKQHQVDLLDRQPAGIHPFVIRTLNIHDEVLVVQDGSVDTTSVARATEEKFREQVPLVGLDWRVDKPSWGEIKA